MFRRRTLLKWMLLWLLVYLCLHSTSNRKGATKLTYDSRQFYIDGEPTRLLTGSVHYFSRDSTVKSIESFGFLNKEWINDFEP